MRRSWIVWTAALAVVLLGAAFIIVLATPGDLNVIDSELGDAWAYLFVFACVTGDAVVPILPGETVVNAAAVLASQGQLEIGWIIVAACVGAILGDNILYWIARLSADRLEDKVARVEEDKRVQTVLRIIGDRAPLFIVLGRYVPGVRFFVNATMGMRAYPYQKFLLWSSIGGVIWGTYTALLAYWVGNALSGYPITSFLISGGITTVAIVAVFWLEHRRSSGGGGDAAPAPAAD